MSATITLRRHLSEVGIHHEPHGRYTTVIPVGDIIWYAQDRYDGTLRLSVPRALSPAQVVETITGPCATMTSICDEDGVGHSECNACGRTVDKHMHFCPWCGARFIDKESK